MFNTKKFISRRTVLRGAGAAIALPLLDAMIPASTALAKTAAAPKPRMGFIYFPHGAVMDAWMPKQTGPGFEFSPILKPLEPFRSYVTVVSGLRNKEGESSDPHGIIAGTWLSCVNPRNPDRGGDRGVTADQIAARHIGQDTPLPSLEIAGEGGGGTACATGVESCGFGATVSFRTPNQPLPMETNPRKVFYQLFGQGDTAEERMSLLEQSGSVLDYVLESSANLQRKLGPADRSALNDYLESVREVERRVQKLAANADKLQSLPDAPLGVPDDFTELLDVHFEMIALAWQTDQTRVASYMLAKEVSMRTYNMIGVSDAFHPLSHHQNDPAKLEKLVRIQRYHTERFAKFIKRLSEMKEPAGSVLDQSIILFGSNMSNSDLHNLDPLPSVVLGHGCGTIKGGQALKYPQDTPHANLLLTLLNRAGVPIETFGNSTGTFAEV
ncbi:MAG: DUF1552 domain-containing protein [Pseudomonadota bacterium]|jgi:Protein of unknown function (DUF1552).|nr:MAG: hypothetical protein DIU56_00940 [Pseudomonadota bacterium]